MKQSVISQMTTDELKDQVYEYQKSLEKLKATHAITPLENPSEIRNKRRSIARMLTEIAKRNNQVA